MNLLKSFPSHTNDAMQSLDAETDLRKFVNKTLSSMVNYILYYEQLVLHY